MEEQNLFQRSRALSQVEMRKAQHSGACYAEHAHDEFSFGLIDQGRARYLNHRNYYDVGQGTLVTINPGDTHACNPEAGVWSYRMLFVNTHWVAELQAEVGGSKLFDYQPFEAAFCAQSSLIEQSFNRLYDYLQHQDEGGLAETALISFLAPLFANTQHQEPTLSQGIVRAHTLLLDRLGENIPLEELANEAGLNRYTLLRQFKQAYGQAPHVYQIDQRIRRAKRLLREGESLADTAATLGFADQSHFQRHFKRRVAITPRQYQQAC